MTACAANILLVEDDEDDYLLTLDLIEEVADAHYCVTWVSSFEKGIEKLVEGGFDICLVDFRIGGQTGLDFVERANELGLTAPIVFLTGMGDRQTDLAAMHAGAYDFLQKSELSSAILDRAIRYSVNQAQSRRALMEKTTLLQATLENTGAAIAAINADGKLVTWNDRFTALYGALVQGHGTKLAPRGADPELAGIPLDDCIPVLSETREDLDAGDGRILSIRRNRTPDGGAVIVCHDVTQSKHAEWAMRRAVQEAKAASAAKSAFLANVSHELRTPLNAIIGFADLILGEIQGPVGCPEYENYMRFIKDSGDALLNIINTTLDLSRIEANEYVLDRQPVDFEEVVNGAVRRLSDEAALKQVGIEVDVRAGCGNVSADEVALGKILSQLLSNAIKFSRDGGQVVVEAKASGNDLNFDITDFGIGMDPRDIQSALKPFSQVDQNLTRNYEGLGLGLPLARALVGLHGGRLSLKSVPDHGTRVSVVLPEAIVSAGAGEERPGARTVSA